ncbi:hypothetical protein [Mucilaginibacter arboris]|uniref:Entericidin n=1 Tax=Mucilaginibacter arboris TaxID=2682090 RepID=A0A7K1SVB3_9SPHI|nr:hypothetical protein [Mucilaginibacter arboris]MVN21224.1 hypothetical protein [Mucilaginibacter arboris]
MKKFSLIIFIASGLALSACNSSAKTGGAQADSGSYGSSGASDTTKAVQSSSMGTSATGNATTSSGSDTSKTGN